MDKFRTACVSQTFERKFPPRFETTDIIIQLGFYFKFYSNDFYDIFSKEERKIQKLNEQIIFKKYSLNDLEELDEEVNENDGFKEVKKDVAIENDGFENVKNAMNKLNMMIICDGLQYRSINTDFIDWSSFNKSELGVIKGVLGKNRK